jgi:nucleoside-diphosphate-sugar epimerase
MRVLVTGATGFVGSALVSELLRAGHQVIGLARSARSAEALTAAGAQVHRGDLADGESLREAAALSDGVIHTAFNHDFSDFAASAEVDRQAIGAIGKALEGSPRPFIITAGLPIMTGRPATEDDVETPAGQSPRRSEQVAMELVARGVRVSVVRMAQVHDQHRQGFATHMMAIAREKGVSAYAAGGLNRWAAVHRSDAAVLYRLALERGTVGARYHAVGEEGVALGAIAEAIGRRLQIPTVELALQAAISHFGPLARPISMDAPGSSALTRKELGWSPLERPGFLADIEHVPHYILEQAKG